MTSNSPQDSNSSRTGLVDAGRKIEEESFRIIEEEMGKHDFPPDQWRVIRRVIHSTGDFDHAHWIRFHPRAIESGINALRGGCSIFTDTRMIGVGLSPWRLKWFGNEVVTPVVQDECQKWAEEMGITRSVAGFRHFAKQFDGCIVAIGNAPTALLEVIRLVKEEGIRPALIIGVPVGFVQALESKEALWRLKDQPAITILDRKGGSSIAVAILHALLELAKTNH